MNVLKALKSREDEIRQKFGVKKIGVFGSFVRGEERKRSDVDVLVEFKAGHSTFDNYMELKFFLEKLFGKKVDLITSTSVRPQFRKTILGEVAYA